MNQSSLDEKIVEKTVYNVRSGKSLKMLTNDKGVFIKREKSEKAGMQKGYKTQKVLSREEMKEEYRKMLAPHYQKIAKALIQKAKKGDVMAIKEYHDRFLGKVMDSLDITSGGLPMILPAQLIAKNQLNVFTEDKTLQSLTGNQETPNPLDPVEDVVDAVEDGIGASKGMSEPVVDAVEPMPID